jgi:hypothetical protein
VWWEKVRPRTEYLARFVHWKGARESRSVTSDPAVWRGSTPTVRPGSGSRIIREAKEEALHNATKTGALLAAAALLMVPSAALGQEKGHLSLDARGGVMIPAGTLATLTDLGGVAGATLAYHFHPNVAIRADFDYAKLDDGEDEFGVVLSPPMKVYYLGGGFEVKFNRPKYQDLPFTFDLNLGAGVTKMQVDDTFDPGHPANGFDHRYLTFDGGAKIGYQATDWLNLFAQGQAYLIIVETGDTSVFPEQFDHAWLFPLTAGARVNFRLFGSD